MTVTGDLARNKFARPPSADKLKELGLRIVEGPTPVKDPRILAQKMFTTDGQPLPLDKLQSYILEKL